MIEILKRDDYIVKKLQEIERQNLKIFFNYKKKN